MQQPDPQVVAKRLYTLAKRTRQGRLDEREVTYLDALLTHWYETSEEWRTQR